MSWLGELLGFEFEAPPLTDRQEAQLAQSDALIERRIQEGEDITPSVLSAMGLVRDSSGNLRNQTSEEFYASLDPIAQREFTNINTTFDRIEAAQAGDKSAFLQDEDRRILEQVQENRARQGGQITGDELATATGKTTADIQTLEAQQRVSGIRGDQERRDLETRLQGVNQGNIGIFRNTQGNRVVQTSAFPNRASSTLSGILDAQQPSQYQQGLDLKTNQFGAEQRGTFTGAVGAGILEKLFS